MAQACGILSSPQILGELLGSVMIPDTDPKPVDLKRSELVGVGGLHFCGSQL